MLWLLYKNTVYGCYVLQAYTSETTANSTLHNLFNPTLSAYV